MIIGQLSHIKWAFLHIIAKLCSVKFRSYGNYSAYVRGWPTMTQPCWPDAPMWGAKRSGAPLCRFVDRWKAADPEQIVPVLSRENRRRLFRAARWIYAAREVWDYSTSSSYIALIAALESLAGEENP